MQLATPEAGQILGAFFALLGALSALMVGAGWALRKVAVLLGQRTGDE